LNVSKVNVVAILDIVADNTNFQGEHDSVRSNDEILMIHMDKVNREVGFSTFQSMVEVCYIFVRVCHKLIGVVCAHGNDNLFLRRAFGHHIDPRLGFVFFAEDSLVDFFDFLFNNLGKFSLVLRMLPIFLDNI